MLKKTKTKLKRNSRLQDGLASVLEVESAETVTVFHIHSSYNVLSHVDFWKKDNFKAVNPQARIDSVSVGVRVWKFIWKKIQKKNVSLESEIANKKRDYML